MPAALRTVTTLISLAGLLLVSACSSGAGAKSSPVAKQAAPTLTAPALSTPATSADSASSASSATSPTGLSGSWNGQYSGQFAGTFKLTWTQTGSNLSGTITLTNPALTLSLTGSLSGATITFGTVGSTHITYTGDVAGNLMLGSYAMNGQTVGTWKASRA